MQRTPAGLPSGMPGMGDEMDGAMQQAPQPLRQASTSEYLANLATGSEVDRCLKRRILNYYFRISSRTAKISAKTGWTPYSGACQ